MSATWVESLFQRETVPLLQSSLGFAHHKQLTIMNNIANVENPYYKRQDVPGQQFMNQLERAIAERAEKHINEFRMGETFDIRIRGRHYPVPRVKDGQEWGPERHDENSVVIEKEMSDLAKNTIMIETMQRLLKKKLGMLRSSLRDRVA